MWKKKSVFKPPSQTFKAKIISLAVSKLCPSWSMSWQLWVCKLSCYKLSQPCLLSWYNWGQRSGVMDRVTNYLTPHMWVCGFVLSLNLLYLQWDYILVFNWTAVDNASFLVWILLFFSIFTDLFVSIFTYLGKNRPPKNQFKKFCILEKMFDAELLMQNCSS